MEKATTGPPLSEAEKTVFDLMGTVNDKFRHKEVDPPGSMPFYVLYSDAAPSLDTAILTIGQTFLEEMGAVYHIYPEVVKNALPFGIEHEAAHVEGTYSAAYRIRRRYANPGSLECVIEREYKANLQAMTSRRNEPGMTFEKLEDEVAAYLWLMCSKAYRVRDIKTISAEVFIEHYYSYIEENFPKLGEEFKEQITEKIFEIDNEYRRRYKEKLDREASQLSFGHEAVMPEHSVRMEKAE